MAKERKFITIKAPVEFNAFLDGLTKDFSRQTGFPENKSATMRRMATKLPGKLVTRSGDFDWILIGRKKKR